MKKMKMGAALAVAILTLSPAAAVAQNTTEGATTYTTTTQEREDDDNDFPWGLLGLLGLAGLLGRKKNDRDIHVDARHNTRP